MIGAKAPHGEGERMNEAERTSGAIIGKDGAALYYQTRRARTEKARMVIAHGLGEHSGRYQRLVDRLVMKGIGVWTYDQRGHGMSDGPRGHTDSFDSYVYDLGEIMKIVIEDKPPDCPLFLLGHSMGGLIAILFAQKDPHAVDGLIVSSPALGLPGEPPRLKVALGRVMSVIWPRLPLSNQLDVGKISHDEAVVEAYKADPLVHGRVSVRWFTAFEEAIALANKNPDKLTTPVLMQIAGDDHLVSAPASRKFFERLSEGDKTIHVYDEFYHEVYNEKGSWREQATADLMDWLDERIIRARSASA